MSVTAMSRTFWTEFPELVYVDKNGKRIGIKDTTAKIVLLAIADNADDFGENSFQSFETLASKSSIERRSVMRAVRALIANGYLKVAGLSVYGTNNYSVCLDKLGMPPKKRAVTGRPKTRDSHAKSGDSDAGSGDSDAPTGDSQSPESSLESPSLTPQPSRKPDLVDAVIRYQVQPKAVQRAIAEHFKLTPNWEARFNKQFMEWVVQEEVLPSQIITAAETWRKDKRFNWSAPSLKAIQEHWLELINPNGVPTAPGLDENGARTMTAEEAADVRAQWKQALSPIIEETNK